MNKRAKAILQMPKAKKKTSIMLKEFYFFIFTKFVCDIQLLKTTTTKGETP